MKSMSKTEVKYGNEIYHLDIENEVKNLVSRVFDEIVKSSSIEELNQVLRKFDSKYVMSEDKYPKIEFSIRKNEFEKLNDFSLNEDDTIKLINDKVKDNTIAKLLYALAWKNGDLVKLQHIIKGIKNDGKIDDEKEDGLVFYQFGKHLTKNNNEPIIDQHVLRAFAIYKENNLEKISKLQKMELINKSNMFLIKEYKTWLSDEISMNLKNENDSVYYIDKILFALGKTIKHKSKSIK
jgi:signal recognition particle subunit SEC65